MPKILKFTNIKIVLTLFSVLALSESVLAQPSFPFDLKRSLRIDFYLGGKENETHFYLEQYKEEPLASRSPNQLIYPNYGTFRIQLFDMKTHKLLFSKGFNSLLSEWQHTEKATKERKLFYHSIQLPFPITPILLKLDERDSEGNFNTIYFEEIAQDNHNVKKEFPEKQIVKTLIYNGTPDNKLDIAILAEGYMDKEKDKFFADAQRMVDYMFSIAPFAKHKNKFNIYAVASVSTESGTDIPGEGIFRKTTFDSSFYTFDMPRYLTAPNIKAVADVASVVPYDQVYILVNTNRYGGGGFYNHINLVSSDHSLSTIVFVHELGHGLVGLADEYYDSSTSFEKLYNLKVEPWEPNITTLSNFEIKWKDKIKKGTPIPTPRSNPYLHELGAFQGGGYVAQGIYSPMQNCRMKDNDTPYFCPPCNEAIEKAILFHTK